MTISDAEDINLIVRARQEECAVEWLAFMMRLRFLQGFNWGTVVLPAVLSVISGSALMADWAGDGPLKTSIGVITLVGAVLVAIHRSLGCEAYQEEANRLIREYRSLEAKFRTLGDLGLGNQDDRFLECEQELAALRQSAKANVPDRVRSKARKKLDDTSTGCP